MFQVGDSVVFEMTGSRIEGLVQQITQQDCYVQIIGTRCSVTLPMRRLKPLVFGRFTTSVE
ncbi:hypothetical protein BCV69DRAFT_300473 [Microstroma glucosiphilum]|uniref:Hypervirulence associated protein TUDOR domain-containing protein n=1 Tax=Pseudomicrostroma glucosiphilum TaxID=1684307 RepID=A0A316U2R7_9BASI|nr:hypothetical protein BCV69DRAFT_300473 [Pseudomicrostroma glucosiphilum]PWN19138.1 hypothetical protein BCV69DRAFT_300473 [Pseudomicrostroma glucosiphilum]